MLQFVNLTPHTVIIERPDDDDVVINPSGEIARLESIDTHIGDLAGIPVVARKFGLASLPPPGVGVVFIVSSLVMAGCPSRSDLAAPDTGVTARRNLNGDIIAVTRLVVNDSLTKDKLEQLKQHPYK